MKSLGKRAGGARLERMKKSGVQLVMAKLGEAIEPVHADRVAPWWRDVDTLT